MKKDEQGTLFEQIGSVIRPNTKGMARRGDPKTSHDAAKDVAERDVSKLQAMVLQAFADHGPMNDRELERLPQFAKYAQSTVRKRRTELSQRGKLVLSDFGRKSPHGCMMQVWELP